MKILPSVAAAPAAVCNAVSQRIEPARAEQDTRSEIITGNTFENQSSKRKTQSSKEVEISKFELQSLATNRTLWSLALDSRACFELLTLNLELVSPTMKSPLPLLAAVLICVPSALGGSRNDWYWGSLVNLHIDNHSRLVGKGKTAGDIATLLQTLPVDMVQVSAYGADGAMTTYPSTLLSRKDLAGWDTLAVWKEAAQKAGKRFHVYINTRGLSVTKEHPDWMQVDATGKGKGKNGGLDACARPSPDGTGYLEALLLPLLTEIMERYRPDGIWVDGDHARTRTCYCRHCKSAWLAHTGQSEPPASASAPDWPRWLAFEQQRYDDYRRRMADVVHRINPAASYTSNHSWKKASLVFEKDDPRSAPEFADTISADLSHGRALGVTRAKAMFLSAERHTPWDIMNLVYQPSEISRRRVLQQGAVTLAHGGSWFLWTPGGDPLAPEAFARSLECARFVRDRAPALGRSTSINPVAVLVSETAWREERTGGRAGFAGLIEPQHWALMLEDARFGVDLLNETDLSDGLGHYRVLIVPNQRILSTSSLERLKSFASADGTLILTGATLFESEAENPAFTTLTGAKRERLEKREQTFTAGSKRIVFEDRWIVAPHETSVLAKWDDGLPLAISHPFGSGRVIYVSAGNVPVPDFDGFVPHLLDLCGVGPSVRFSGPGAKEHFLVSFRQKEGRTVVHLTDVGSSVRGVRQAEETTQLIDEAPPIPEVTLHWPWPEPAAITVVPSTATATHTWNDGILTATIRNIDTHAALLLPSAPAHPLQLLPPGLPLSERHALSHYQPSTGLDEDFEIASRGQAVSLPAPFNLRGRGRTSVEISDEAASSGKRCLKFVDAAGEPSFLPMLGIKTTLRLPLRFTCDLRIDPGAKVSLEFREQENRREYPVGPSVVFDAASGKITTGSREIGEFPVGAWFSVDVRLPGNGATASELCVRRPSQAPLLKKLPHEDAKFTRCGWVGVIGSGNREACFFLDHLKIRAGDKPDA